MTTTTQTIKHRRIAEISPARKLTIGIVEVLIGLLIYFLFTSKLAPNAVTVFNMTPGGIDIGTMADLAVP